MLLNRKFSASKQGGFVLVMVLLFTSSLVYLSLSSFGSIESKVAVQRLDGDSLRAELAAQAGIEHAKSRLMDDLEWDGTDEWVDLGGSKFFVAIAAIEDDEGDGGITYQVTVEGRSGHGKRVLAMNYEVSAGNDFSEVGCYFLSSNIDINKSHFNADVFLADAPGSVYDYTADAFGNETWSLNTDNLGSTNISNTMVNHTSFQFTSNNYFKGNYDKVVLDTAIYMPAWNLDFYLIPSDTTIVLSGIEEVSETNFNQTLVVLLDEGDTFNVNDCNLHGGLVIYVAPDYDLRSGARNAVSIDKSNIGTGASPHIGLIAPACEVKGGGDHINIHGFCFWNSIDDLDNAHVNGALIVVNEVDDLDSFNFHAHPPTLSNPPEGVTMKSSTPGITLVTGGESLL
ncbi:MAG: hypothetical protein HQ519_06055 [Planctomycetes bacterium]|nr:hypothetical protein [Planctomycetota bacterium]